MANSSVGVQDSGSNYNYFEEPRRPHLPKSLFDLSYINTGTADVGLLIPIYLQETVPGDEFTISCEALLRCVNPPVVPLLSRLRVFFHYYWSSCESLWKGFPMFITKGRSGKYELSAPVVDALASGDVDDYEAFQPTSLSHYLGFSPVSADSAFLSGAVQSIGFSAMPFMMYLRIYRDYYMNQTLVNAADEDGQNLSWFPLDDEEFRLPVSTVTSGSNAVYINGDGSSYYTADNIPAFLTDSDCRLGMWRWRNWSDDYFTTARPWPQRGEEASVLGSISGDDVQIGVTPSESLGFQQLFYKGYYSNSGVVSNATNTTNDSTYYGRLVNVSSTSVGLGLLDNQNVAGNGTSTGVTSFRAPLSISSDAEISLNLTLSALRELNAAQRIMEKMALVDGSYGEFVVTFFGQKDPNARQFKPTYIGGAYQKIDISEVVNTADTYSSSSGSGRSQGSQTGHASTYGNGNVGKFRAPSYGFIMGIMSIVPDTMYFQGVNRQFVRQNQEDWFIPERAGLSPQSILNKELYADLEDDASSNDSLYGYQDRFDEMRYRPNEIHGKVADPGELSFFPYTQARYFTALPTLSPEFVSMGTPCYNDPTSSTNVRKDWLTSETEVPFIYQVANKVRAVRPLSYRAQPAELFDTRG